MENSGNESSKMLQEEFDPKAYKHSWGPLLGKSQDIQMDIFKCLVKFFKDSNIRGITMLDIGSGPTVHNLAAVCQHFSHIILSDHLERNRREVEKWLCGDADAIDWSDEMNKAAEASGYTNKKEGRRIIEGLIRRNVKGVIDCDVRESGIVPKEYAVPYDLVLSRLTLEMTAGNYEAYKQSIKGINPLVKLGGHVVLVGVLMGDKWECGNQWFYPLKLSLDDVQNALLEAGFDEIVWQIINKRDPTIDYKFDYFYCLHCTKVKGFDL